MTSNVPHDAAPGSPPQPLGVLLVANGLLTQEQLTEALAEQQQTGRPLGEIVVARGWVSVPLVAQALAAQRGGLTKEPPPPVAPAPVPVDVPARPPLRLATPERLDASGAEAEAHEADALQARVAELEGTIEEARAREAQALEQLHAAAAERGELEAARVEAAALRRRLEEAHDQLGVVQGSDASLADLERRLAETLSELAATSAKTRMLEQEVAERTRAYVEVADELARLQSADLVEPVAAATRHLVFATIGTAYAIVELDGPPPAPGDVVELESGRHLVVRVGSSPLARSALRCAYTIPA